MAGSATLQRTSDFNNSFVKTMTGDETRNKFGGVMNKVMGTVKGKKVLIKSDAANHALAEYICYRLGRKLGIQVNEVSLIECGELFGLNHICSVHLWEDDLILARDADGEIGEKFYPIMRFFDLLICNGDRHNNNYGYLRNELFLIDHSFCDPWYSSFAEYELQKIIRDHKDILTPYVLRFVKMNKADWREIVKTPKHINHKFSESKIEGFYTRMQALKDFLKPIARKLVIEGKMVANG